MPTSSPDTRPAAVCVFCGSNAGHDAAYADAARRLGVALAESHTTLIYGGGNAGLMRAVADAVLGAGGRAVGVMPQHLVDREVAHRTLSELHVVDTMHQRKQRMADLADAFILLPGGFGSWEEFCEAVTWSNLGLHGKVCGILNVENYYGPLLAMIDRAVEHDFVRPSQREAIVVDGDPAALLRRMAEAR